MQLLDFETRSGQLMVMKVRTPANPKKVRVAELKARLSHYLRLARAGETVTVCDRDTPIARIVPYVQEIGPHRLTMIEPEPGSPKLHEIPIPPAPKLDFDIVELLREDRDKR